jgi:hypothetical protein
MTFTFTWLFLFIFDIVFGLPAICVFFMSSSTTTCSVIQDGGRRKNYRWHEICFLKCQCLTLADVWKSIAV